MIPSFSCSGWFELTPSFKGSGSLYSSKSSAKYQTTKSKHPPMNVKPALNKVIRNYAVQFHFIGLNVAILLAAVRLKRYRSCWPSYKRQFSFFPQPDPPQTRHTLSIIRPNTMGDGKNARALRSRICNPIDKERSSKLTHLFICKWTNC